MTVPENVYVLLTNLIGMAHNAHLVKLGVHSSLQDNLHNKSLLKVVLL